MWDILGHTKDYDQSYWSVANEVLIVIKAHKFGSPSHYVFCGQFGKKGIIEPLMA